MKTTIKKLSSYKRIIVTGPNRTGTTYFSNLLAEELDYEHIDEDRYRYDEGVFEWYFKKTNIVVQGPGMSYKAHSLCDEYDDVCIVFMMRSIDDIKKSSQRIRDQNRTFSERWERFERVFMRYISDRIIGNSVNDYIPSQEQFDSGSSAKFRYQVWENIQKPLCKNYLEVHYDELKSHDTFIDKGGRKGFGPKQTKTEKENNSFKVFLRKIFAAIKFRLIRYYSKNYLNF